MMKKLLFIPSDQLLDILTKAALPTVFSNLCNKSDMIDIYVPNLKESVRLVLDYLFELLGLLSLDPFWVLYSCISI